ncbi:MAG: SusC/RagA family TonB-linked outer membrane protein [Flavobacteriaceae bacterium]|jgi:TonB-linked SusC/RagA family outer membrane protein|nr:SusC/RagA family TonB-linked outer membrane protein [Flavobacteriaceae bacterium]
MKTQILTFFGSRKAIPLLFFVSLISSPIYAVSNDKHLFFNVSELLQDTKQKPTIKLSGTVKDSFGALRGVIVTVGTTVVTTDLDGKYTTYITTGDTITFSMMGYKDQSMVYSGGSVLNITLTEDSSTLDEIVVNTGYYSVKDRERTGSIARVTAKDIEFQPVVNPLQAIQGRMAGVSITQNSGVPGGGFDIQIRGRNSLRNTTNSNIDGNKPLIIIDGVPISSDKTTDSGFSVSILPMADTNPLNAINPNDIASIEILKDADATAIYGSRGANGVILITTKKAKQGTTDFSITSSTAISKVPHFMRLLNTTEFNEMRDEAFLKDGTPEDLVYYHDLNGNWDRNRYTDWQRELIGGTAISKNIQLGISGGNKQTQFLISANHGEDTTVFPTDKGYKRNSVLINLNHLSNNERLQISSSTNYSIQNNNLIATDLTNTALTLAPNAPALYDANGNLNWQNGTFENPLASMYETYSFKNIALILNANLSYLLTQSLSFKLNTGITNSNFDENKLTPHTVYNPNLGYSSANSTANKAIYNNESYLIEPQLNWVKQISKHSFNILVGSTYQQSNKNALNITASNFTTDALLSNISAAKTRDITQANNSQYKYVAVFSRFNYIYQDKYILNVTARRDGSSRFGTNNKFGNFGAIGAAWVFSNEDFLNTVPWLSYAKIRASYGTSGNDNIGDYQYLDTYTISTGRYGDISSLLPSRLYNPDFSWEKTTKTDLALEFSVLNHRINTSINWYRNISKSQLVGLPLASTTGFPNIQDNLDAKVLNTGWEFSIQTINIQKKDWNWSSSFNISFLDNKLLSFPNLEGSSYANSFIIGRSTSIKKLYQFEGIDPITGLYQFKDFNQDGKLTPLEDKQAIKEINIDFHGGLQNTVSYKNFTLDFLFHFVKQQNYNYNYNIGLIGPLTNQPVEVLNHFTPQTPIANYPYYTTGNDNTLYTLSNHFSSSDKTIGDASFVRLKNLSLSYTLDLKKTKIKNARIYFQGQNLWTITNYFGLDPEFNILGYLPPLRTYAFGIQLTL